MQQALSLEATTFLHLYDRLNETTKFEVFGQIMNKSGLDKILANKKLQAMIKVELLPKIKHDEIKQLLLHTKVDISVLLNGFALSGYIEDLTKCVYAGMQQWKYYQLTESGNIVFCKTELDITIFNGTEIDDKFRGDLIPYEHKDFNELIPRFLDKNLYKIAGFEKLRIIPWYWF